MQVLGIGRVTAEARVVGGDEPRQPCVRRGHRSSGLTRGYPRQPQLFDHSVLQCAKRAFDASSRFRRGRLFACGLLAQMMSMFSANSARPNWVTPSPPAASLLFTRKMPCLSL